jgi:hypothetical protein
MPEKFDIYSKIFYRDVEKFVRHLCLLVLRHQMPVSNYFVNSFYSVALFIPISTFFANFEAKIAQNCSKRPKYVLEMDFSSITIWFETFRKYSKSLYSNAQHMHTHLKPSILV